MESISSGYSKEGASLYLALRFASGFRLFPAIRCLHSRRPRDRFAVQCPAGGAATTIPNRHARLLGRPFAPKGGSKAITSRACPDES
jgi:hypothetical protein